MHLQLYRPHYLPPGDLTAKISPLVGHLIILEFTGKCTSYKNNLFLGSTQVGIWLTCNAPQIGNLNFQKVKPPPIPYHSPGGVVGLNIVRCNYFHRKCCWNAAFWYVVHPHLCMSNIIFVGTVIAIMTTGWKKINLCANFKHIKVNNTC